MTLPPMLSVLPFYQIVMRHRFLLSVRRLLLYLEKSIEEGTRWVVFEPNDEKLWFSVKLAINQFLITVWKDGALMGTTPEEAFFVKCDSTTMTQDDIDDGKVQ